MKKVHYAGAIKYRNAKRQLVEIAAGRAACCTGGNAERVRKKGNHSYSPDEVTCTKCLQQLEKHAKFIADKVKAVDIAYERVKLESDIERLRKGVFGVLSQPKEWAVN